MSEIFEFLTAYIHKCAVHTIDSYNASLCLSQFQRGTSPRQPPGLAQKHCPGGRDLTFESCPGAGNSTRAGILWKFKVKHFVRVLVLSMINTVCPENC